MKITTYTKEEQSYNEFNGGEIQENQPIGFPQDGGKQRAFSNLFYWTHAWTEEGGTIALHPHKGFEIISFVLKGKIEHFDTANKKWNPLTAGDIQIIRAGNGISHSEKLLPKSEIFQIWLDPDLSQSLKKTPSYNDYKAETFPIHQENGMSVKTFKGDGSPLCMDTDIIVKEFFLEPGQYTLKTEGERISSFYLIEGNLSLENAELKKDGFAIIEETEEIPVTVYQKSKLFLIECPVETGYETYA